MLGNENIVHNVYFCCSKSESKKNELYNIQKICDQFSSIHIISDSLFIDFFNSLKGYLSIKTHLETDYSMLIEKILIYIYGQIDYTTTVRLIQVIKELTAIKIKPKYRIFLEKIIVWAESLLYISDMEINICSVELLTKICGISKEYFEIIIEILPVCQLHHVVTSVNNDELQKCCIVLAQNYSKNCDFITQEECMEYFGIIAYVFENSNNPTSIASSLYLIHFIAKKNSCWVTFMNHFHLLNTINEKIIYIKNTRIKVSALKVLADAFNANLCVSCINIDAIMSLLIHHQNQIQNAAIGCICNCINKNNNYLEVLLENGLIDKLLFIVENGSHKAKIKVIMMLESIVKLIEPEFILSIIQSGFIGLVLSTLEGTDEKISPSICDTLFIMINKLTRIGQEQSLIMILEESNIMNFLEERVFSDKEIESEIVECLFEKIRFLRGNNC